MDINIFGYIGTTIGIHSFIPSYATPLSIRHALGSSLPSVCSLEATHDRPTIKCTGGTVWAQATLEGGGDLGCSAVDAILGFLSGSREKPAWL